jgi:predicted MPP superfamily phosphohydrolase
MVFVNSLLFEKLKQAQVYDLLQITDIHFLKFMVKPYANKRFFQKTESLRNLLLLTCWDFLI